MSAAAAGFPSWVRLETVVLRRDKDKAFPDATTAPIGACGFTSWGAFFRFAFSFAEPPHVSHLFAQLPDFPKKEKPLAIVATHRRLALFRVGTRSRPEGWQAQEFFVYDASVVDDDPFSPLKPLPPCTLPHMDDTAHMPRRRRRRRRNSSPAPSPPKRGLLAVKSMGLLCRGGGEEQHPEFAVAELQLFKPSIFEVYADIYLLKSSSSSSSSGGEWSSMRVPILCGGDPDDIWQLCLWQTDAVVPVDRWLCWVDYYRGILFCDVFAEPNPTVSFLRFPLDSFPDTHNRSIACSWLYRGVSVIDAGRALKFVDVTRYDGIGYGALKPGTGFTITCHTLTLGSSMVWNKKTLGSSKVLWSKDCTFTSDELWSSAANPPERLPRQILTFPQVDIDRPHVVHFIVTDFVYVMKKMWLVAIDMNTGTVESCWQYRNGLEDRGTEGQYLTNVRSGLPMPFLHCDFSKYVHPERTSVHLRYTEEAEEEEEGDVYEAWLRGHEAIAARDWEHAYNELVEAKEE